jgi:hypothetical protein
MNVSQAMRKLMDRGVAKVEVHFSGGGDEGGVDNITLYDDKGKSLGNLEESYDGYTYNPTTKQYEQKALTEDQQIAKILGKPVYDKYHTFAGEFYVNGTVTWDVFKGTSKMNGNESVESYEEFEDEETY